jgi:prolipoprotein diacylglyceryltransferase
MASFGAFAGIIAAAFLYSRYRKVKVWKLLDVLSIGLMLGLAVGRLGCYLTGCCYGAPASESLPWAVYYKGILRHPAQLYDIINALHAFFWISVLKKRNLFDGSLILANFIIYSFGRIIVEFFRVTPGIGGISYNQIFYFILMVVSVVIFAVKWRKKK